MFHSKLHRYAAVSAALLLGANCGDGPTGATGPTELTRVDEIASEAGISKGYLVKRNSNLAEDITTSQTITPGGGYLSIPGAGLVLYFPQGAVSTPTVITATALKGNRVVYDFQPHGIVFNTPIYAAQELVGTELNTPRAMKQRPPVWGAYLSNGTADIFADGSALLAEVFDAFYHGKGNDALMYFPLQHFSGYAFGSGRRETTTADGF